MRGLACLVLLAVVGSVCAGVLTGQVAYDVLTVAANGSTTSEAAQALTFVCDGNDPVESFQLGPDRWTVSQCVTPTQPYVATAKAYAPAGLSVFTTQTCTTTVAAGLPINSTVPQNIATSGTTDDPTGRRLLSSGENWAIKSSNNVPRFMYSTTLTQEEKLKYLQDASKKPDVKFGGWEEDRGHTNVGRELLSSSQVDCSGAKCVCIGVAYIVAVSYCPGIDSAVDSLQNQVNAAEAHVANATIYWSESITAATTKQGVINLGLNATINGIIANAVTTQAELNTTEGKTIILQADLAAFQAQATVTAADIYANLSTGLADSAAYTDQRVGALQNVTLANFAKMINYTSYLATQITNNGLLENTRLIDVASSILQLSDALYKSIGGTNQAVDRQDKALIFQSMDTIEANGGIPFVRDSQPGTLPVPLYAQTDAQLTVFIDILQVNYLLGVSGLNQAHQHTITLNCNVNTLSENVPTQITPEEALTLIGNTGCLAQANATGVGYVRTCQCWLQIGHKYCYAPSSFEWTDITTTTSRTAYDLVASMCTGSAQPSSGNYDGVVYDNMPSVFAYISALSCQSGLVSSFQVVSFRAGVLIVEPNFSDDVCTINYFNLFVVGTISNPTLPQVIITDWVNYWPLLQTELMYNEITTYGVRPGGITSTFVPFVTATNGKTAQCYESSIDGITTETNILYEIVALPLVTEVITTVYDQAPDCTTIPGVCIPKGNVVSSVTSAASITVNSPTTQAFPDNTILIGELIPLSSGGMTYVIDSPENSKCLSPDPETCKGTNGYLRWNIPAGYDVATAETNPAPADLSTWEAQNPGVIYDHDAPTSALEWQHPVVNGRCVNISDISPNLVCEQLALWNIYSSTRMRSGQLVLSPITWQYTVTLDVGLGTPSIYVAPGCPTTTYLGGDLTGTYVQISNPYGYQLYLSISITTNSTCGGDQGNVNGDLAASQSRQISLLAFANCGNVTVQVFQVSQVTGALSSCGPPVVAFVSTATQSNIFTSDLFVNATSVTIENNVVQATAAVSLATIDYLLQFAYTAALVATQPNITLEEIKASAFSNSSFQAFTNDLITQAAGVNFNNPTAADALNALTAQYNALAAQAASQLATLQAQAAALSNLTSQYEAIAARVPALENGLVVSEQALIAADNAAIAAGDAQSAAKCAGFFASVECTLENAVEVIVVIAVIAIAIAFAIWLYKRCSKPNPPATVAGRRKYNKKNKGGVPPKETEPLTSVNVSGHKPPTYHQRAIERGSSMPDKNGDW